MNDRNLPIKLVMQRGTDTKKNTSGGGIKFFGEVTPELQDSIADGFQSILGFYEDVFNENELVPAVGKLTVKPEAIAKSYKPNDLCRNLPIIGSEDLGEIYIKVSKKGIEETVKLVKSPPSQKFRANLTTISNIEPISAESKLSYGLQTVNVQGSFDNIKHNVKLKLFDFQNEFDNTQILGYVTQKLAEMGFADNHEIIAYGNEIRFIKVAVESYSDVLRIAAINGIKTVDFFQEYSLPLTESFEKEVIAHISEESTDSEITIGIIDGGIGDNNPHLTPYIVGREVYVSEQYQNHRHASFIASMIQFGDEMNMIATTDHRRFRFVDVVAIPNGDLQYGPVDSIGEVELMEIIEEVMEKHAAVVKIWNLSLGIEKQICQGTMSDLGIFLDYIQDKYKVQIFVSSGNLRTAPLRGWPPQDEMGERDRIIAPADSVRAVTVGSIALFDSPDSIVNKNEPSPFSRRGPGANNTVKPDVVDYGGNYSVEYKINDLGMKGMSPDGKIVEGNGTSYSTPRALRKFATIYDEMVEKDGLIAKAMLIHSARMNSRELLDGNQDNIKYYGFGMPSNNVQDILQCSKNEVTLIFKQKILQGTHLEMYDFPFPPSLIKDGKYYGEIGMTLVYNPALDESYGREYCRSNIDASFGIYKTKPSGQITYSGCVPLESTWDEKYEQARVEHGFKWSPVKSYYRAIKNGLQLGDGWKIRIDMNSRNEITIPEQEFVLIITIRDPGGNDIYTEIVNGLRERGYITNNLETRYQVRQRQ